MNHSFKIILIVNLFIGSFVYLVSCKKMPLAAFTASSTIITSGEIVNFTDHSVNNPTSWSWDFGDGGTSTSQNPSHTYTTAGTYTVTLTVTNSSGSGSLTKPNYITVKFPAPVAAFIASTTTINTGGAVNFTDQSTNSPTNWSWNFGDGGTSTSQNPSHTYTTAGTYTVTLTVTNSSGSDSETKANYITVNLPAPVAAFTASSTIITVGKTVNFTDQSINSPTNWSWNFGDGGTSTTQNPSHTYLTAGAYTVTLTVTNSGGSDSEIKSNYITVEYPVPVAAFTASTTTINTGGTVNFTDQSTNSPTSWSWDFGDGGTSTSQNPSHTYTTAGTYTVTLTVTNSSGSDSETKSNYITVNPPLGNSPVAAFTVSSTNIREGQNIHFTDQSTNLPTSWSWDFGDGGTSTLKDPSHIYWSVGVFTVSLNVTNSYGSDTKVRTNHITVNESINGDKNTIEDYEGNIYKAVKIGNQWWMAENIKATKYDDETPIPLVENGSSWIALGATDKAYCWYENSSSNRDIYGGLYTWAAVMNGATSSNSNPSGVQGICPDGWHIPSDAEWIELEMYLGMSQTEAEDLEYRGTDEGSKLKETGITHWNSPNAGATNESGFTALPGGYRFGSPFSAVGINTHFWSATEIGVSGAWHRLLHYNHTDIYRGYQPKDDGYSVRCVKD